jgi:hypothetical protein
MIYDHFHHFNLDSLPVASDPSSSFPAIVVPSLLHNHYLRRLFPKAAFSEEKQLPFASSAVLLENADFLLSSCLLFPCKVSLPSSSSVAYQCPANAHLVVFSSFEELILSLYDSKQVHVSPSSSGFASSFIVKGNLSISLPSASVNSFITLEETKSNQGSIDAREATKPSGSISLTSSKDYAFIPSSYAVSFRQRNKQEATSKKQESEDETGENRIREEESKETKSSSSSSSAIFYLQCLVDASNLHSFLSYLSPFASISSSHSHLLTELEYLLSSDLFSSFQGKQQGGQHTIFEKSPRELSLLKEYLSSDLVAATAAATPGSKGSSGATEGEGGEKGEKEQSAATVSSNNRKNRQKRGSASSGGASGGGGGGDFLSWQQSIHWKQLIYSLLLPRASLPFLRSIERTGVVLEWKEDHFIPLDSDSTKYGFTFMICELVKPKMVLYGNFSIIREETEEEIAEAAGYNSMGSRYVISSKEDPSVREAIHCEERNIHKGEGTSSSFSQKYTPQLQRSTTANADNENRDSLFFSYYLTDLKPGTSYQLKLAMLYGSKQGDYSQWSKIFTTKRMSPPSPPLAPMYHSEVAEELVTYQHDLYLIPSTKPLIAKDIRIYDISNEKLFPDRKYRVFGCSLYFTPPMDNGGKEILGYAVYYRIINNSAISMEGNSNGLGTGWIDIFDGEVGAGQHGESEAGEDGKGWLYKGSYNYQKLSSSSSSAATVAPGAVNHKIIIHNLIAGLTYEFKVSH